MHAQCAADPSMLAQMRRLLSAQDTPSPLDEDRSDAAGLVDATRGPDHDGGA